MWHFKFEAIYDVFLWGNPVGDAFAGIGVLKSFMVLSFGLESVCNPILFWFFFFFS